MGAMGADVAIETADVALMGEDLRHLPQAFAHARRARRIMVQNVGLSLGLITALIPLALFGILGLAAVVLVHELAEVFVIANGVRAGRATTCPEGRPATGRAHRSAVPHPRPDPPRPQSSSAHVGPTAASTGREPTRSPA